MTFPWRSKMRTPLSLQSVHSITFKKKVSLVKKKKKILPLRGLYILAMVGRRMNGQTTGLPLRCCVFWMVVLWVVMGLGDHSWERQACIFVGWMRGGSQLSLGCLRSYGRREMCCFQTERESDDAAWMRGGDEWDLLHNRTTFPRFQTEFKLWAPHTFYCMIKACL